MRWADFRTMTAGRDFSLNGDSNFNVSDFFGIFIEGSGQENLNSGVQSS